MTSVLVVFFGAGIGGVFRHLMNIGGVRLFGFLDFPAITMVVNVLGCFTMGVFTSWFAQRAGMPFSQPLRLFLTTGMLGGFTTFSTFSLEFAVLVERGDHVNAAIYALGSLVLCLVAVFAGLTLMRAIS